MLYYGLRAANASLIGSVYYRVLFTTAYVSVSKDQ